jgi:hypothetical protein
MASGRLKPRLKGLPLVGHKTCLRRLRHADGIPPFVAALLPISR